MKIESDKALNKELQVEVSTLRGGMVAQAEKTIISERFAVVRSTKRPSMIITDTKTGKKIEVGICDYYGARQVLNAFFRKDGK